jgi:NADPH-dependent glutamate synthase beta subunit-like oxidoreductase
MQTTRPGVFAAGDLVNGGATVVQAVADGYRAARAILKHLKIS